MSRPANLRSPTRTSLGHRMRTAGSPSSFSTSQTATPAANGKVARVALPSQGTTAESHRPPRSDTQVRWNRPRPIVWESALTAVHRGKSAASRLVDVTTAYSCKFHPGYFTVSLFDSHEHLVFRHGIAHSNFDLGDFARFRRKHERVHLHRF